MTSVKRIVCFYIDSPNYKEDIDLEKRRGLWCFIPDALIYVLLAYYYICHFLLYAVSLGLAQ